MDKVKEFKGVGRYWINQPSTLQYWHKWHGMNVIAVPSNYPDTTYVYFLEGSTESIPVNTSILAAGWH